MFVLSPAHISLPPSVVNQNPSSETKKKKNLILFLHLGNKLKNYDFDEKLIFNHTLHIFKSDFKYSKHSLTLASTLQLTYPLKSILLTGTVRKNSSKTKLN